MPSEAGGRGPTSRPPSADPTVADFTEAELIARISAPLPPPAPWLLVGIGDDAAVVLPERNRLAVLTVDALVEGVHFDRAFTPPAAIGHRALAVNLSDLAAMGASPRLALVSLVLPPALPIGDFDSMMSGLAALARRYGVQIAGGNLSRSPGPLMIDITAVGGVKPRRALTRAGAQAGDELYVTGTIGAAAAGLQMLRAGAGEWSGGSAPQARQPTWARCVQRYLLPEPRVRIGSLIGRNRAASACIDLSDGLGDAVHQMAAASGIGAVVDEGSLPLDPGAREWFESHGGDAVAAAIQGGDDYELLVAVRPRARRRLAALAGRDTPLTRVGLCTEERDVLLRRPDGRTVPLGHGYSHFT
jgi:thiamine-monophosphate kinase